MTNDAKKAKKREQLERLLSLALGSVWLVWAADTALIAAEENRGIYALYFCLHILIAILYFIRKLPRAYPSKLHPHVVAMASTFYIFCLQPSLVPSNLTQSTLILLFGFSIVFWASICLGRNFGIRPVYRGFTEIGPYRFARHPIYTGYMVMDIGFLVENPSVWNLSVILVAAALFLWRAIMEEDVLAAHEPAYVSYMKQVRKRFFPQFVSHRLVTTPSSKPD